MSTLHTANARDSPPGLGPDAAIQHNPAVGMMQSIFSPAARRQDAEPWQRVHRRDGGPKMDWTTPLDCRWAMEIESRVVSDERVGNGVERSAPDAVDGRRGDLQGRTRGEDSDVGLPSRVLTALERDDSYRATGANVWTRCGR